MATSTEDIALLAGLLQQYSPSEHEGPAAEYLVGEMARRGFQAHIDKAGNAVGHIGDGPREVVLLGHIDTVSGWIDVRKEGDALFGRGSVDAKGPLCTFVAAAHRAAERFAARRTGRIRVTVVGAVEEEAATSKGARHLLTRGDPSPSFVVIGEPSHWDRITLGYKGRLLVDYSVEREMSHTAGRAESACEELVSFWQQVRRYADDFNRDKERVFEALDPSLRHVASDSDGLMERAAATLALRLPVGIDAPALKRTLSAMAEPGRVKFYADEVPFRAGKNTELARAFTAAIRAAGGEPAFKVKTGTSDMNVVGPVWNCPIVAYGPGDSNLDHTPNEHVDLAEYGRAIDVLTLVLVTLAQG
jgi:[amino group carrier protein]-lysine/ornithine hydrolase